MNPISTQTAILQALLKGEAYGVEVMDRVEEATGGRVQLGPGSLYPAFRALERDGLVTSREGEPLPERGGRPRVYYKLTGLGERAAHEEREVLTGLLAFGLPALEGV